MKRLLPLALLLLSCTGTSPEPALCDLNEIIPTLGRFGWNESRTDLVEKPIEPVLVECTCEIRSELKSIGDRNPNADAHQVFLSGEPYFLGLPKLGTFVPGFSQDLARIDKFPDVPVRGIEGADEHSSCYEREKYELKAQRYAVAYNTLLLDLILGD